MATEGRLYGIQIFCILLPKIDIMKYYIILLTLFWASCSTALKQEVRTDKYEANTEATSNVQTGALVHIVFFKLKPDADQATVIAEIKKLEAIKEVQNLEVGPFKSLGDKRALSEYSLAMQMTFKDETAYQTYQKHPIHLALKKAVKAFLARPPATYDFIKM